MQKLSDCVSRKFIESYQLSDWEIETDTGWYDISSIHKTIEYDIWSITTESGKNIECADDHIIFNSNFEEIFVKDCVPNNTYIMTIDGPELVSECYNTHTSENMYDITVDSLNHRFYSNGILSHNTECIRVFVLHYILFNEHKTVAILANKEATAQEILSKIQTAYMNLPLWLQQGTDDFSKASRIVLENGCRVLAAATSSDAIRGYTIHALIIDEMAHIDGWDKFYSSVRPTISAGKNTKFITATTPLGLNHAYKFWKDSEEGRNQFKRIFVPWDRVPGRTQEWAAAELASMGGDIAKFDQEYNCVAGKTLVAIKDKETEKEFLISIEQLYEILT